jgi:hypothetical protein
VPRVREDNNVIIKYNYVARDKYWKELSDLIYSKYGFQTIKENKIVEEILLFGFNYFVNKFRELSYNQNKLSFYTYIFWLHEQSTELYFKTLEGYKLQNIPESEFAMYRRILKLILEQGCDIDFKWDKLNNGAEVLVMDEIVQDLIYIGNWVYGFADYVAYQKMIEECYEIKFDKENNLIIDWQFHYGIIHEQLILNVIEDYSKAVVDEDSTEKLKFAIEDTFGIDYNYAGGIIFEIKKHHSPEAPDLQSIEPYVLSLNLEQEFKISKELAQKFYDGFTISRKNKLSIEDAVLKPYSIERYLFKPILVYQIGGQQRAFIGKEKYAESILVLSTNAISWNTIYKDWSDLPKMRDFINKNGNEHDKLLENKIEKILVKSNIPFFRNIKSFKQISKQNIRIDNSTAGEIDFIIINQKLERIYVSEVKYNKSRYEAVGYRIDYSNFVNSYEEKLSKKVAWAADNLNIIKEHFQIVTGKELEINKYKVEGIFIINTPTFYMFNGKYKAITINQFCDYMQGIYAYSDTFFIDLEDDFYEVNHPYFKKPFII